MRFTDRPVPRDDGPPEDPAVLQIGGPNGRLWRWAGTAGAVLAVGGVLVGVFVWFGATMGWAVALVAMMVGYMALMARWTNGGVH